MTFKELEQSPPVCNCWDVRHQLREHIYSRAKQAFERGDAGRDAIKTRAALERRQATLRRFFLKSLGGVPSSNSALNARVVGMVKGSGFKIEKIILESRPKVFVTANLYLPDGRRGRRGAVLFLSGHHHGRQGVYAQVAAALDKRVKGLQVVGGIGSYADFVRLPRYDPCDIKSVVFRGILQYCDLPQLMEWMKTRGVSVS